MRRFALALPALLLLLAVPGTASATLSIALDLGELVGRADLVVLATVESQQVLYDEQGRIVTDVTLRVEESMKGRMGPGARLTVRRLGGAIGDIGMRVEGEPVFRDGERTLVFLSQMPGRAFTRAVGMSQGVLPVRRDGAREIVLPGGTGMSLVRPDAAGNLVHADAALAGPRPLGELLTEIRALVSRSPAP